MLTQHLLILTNNDTSFSATLVTSLFACFLPGSTCWGQGWGGRGAAWSYVTMKRPTVESQTTARLANRVSARERNRSAINQWKRGGGGTWALTWRRSPGLAMASDRGWGRGGETFSATAACQPFTEFLQLILCLQFSRRCGRGKNAKTNRRPLVRRVIRNGAVSSLEVCEQGSARSLLDFGANTSTTTTKKKRVKVKQEKQWRTEKTSMTTFLKVSEQRDVFFFFSAALLLSQPPASANHLCEQVSPDADM